MQAILINLAYLIHRLSVVAFKSFALPFDFRTNDFYFSGAAKIQAIAQRSGIQVSELAVIICRSVIVS